MRAPKIIVWDGQICDYCNKVATVRRVLHPAGDGDATVHLCGVHQDKERGAITERYVVVR